MNPYPNQYQDPDAAIHDYVNRTFAMYDFDGSNTLEINEFACYLRDWYMNMGYGNVNLTQQDVEQAMMKIDNNFDGHIHRAELFRYMKAMWTQPQHFVPNYQQFQQPQYQPIPYVQQPPRPTVILIKGKKTNW